MIAQRNLSLLANRLAKGGGRRFQESVLERDYCLGWFLAELALTDLKDMIAFKGGTALKRCYFGDYRFSEDLDFTLMKPLAFEELLKHLQPVYSGIYEACGIVFRFDREDRHGHENSYTFYLGYEGPLPTGGSVKVDVTLKEKVFFPLEDRPVVRGYEEFTDLPEARTLLVYSLEEIATEKIMALADRARNEARDLFDLWYLTSMEGIEIGGLSIALQEKLEFREKRCEGIADAIGKKEARLRTLWSKRLAYQMASLPEFDEVFRAVLRTLRQADLP